MKAALRPFGLAGARPSANGRIPRLFEAAAPFAGAGFEIFQPAVGVEAAENPPGEG
ncbi:MAG: hypothetical protein WC345_09365 [Smithellaceae bacterium]|jgi:hypothetical protein|nr:hypothetical protein [Smithellaceae bacterium]MDD3259168.1 hypothetical protein [Smithellaceae bacterium]